MRQDGEKRHPDAYLVTKRCLVASTILIVAKQALGNQVKHIPTPNKFGVATR